MNSIGLNWLVSVLDGFFLLITALINSQAFYLFFPIVIFTVVFAIIRRWLP